MRFADGGELEMRPAAAENFHVVIAPASVHLQLPALLFKAGDNFAHEIQTVGGRFSPVVYLFRGIGLLLQCADGQALQCSLRCWAQSHASLITRPTAQDRL